MKENIRAITGNVIYGISKTQNYEPKLLLIHLARFFLAVFLPLISISLPVVLLMGINKEISARSFYLATIVLSLLVALFSLLETKLSARYELASMNNKMKFLTQLFRKRMELPYFYIESSAGQNLFQQALSYLLNDNCGITKMLSDFNIILSCVVNIGLYAGLIIHFDVRLALSLLLLSTIHMYFVNKLTLKKYTLEADTLESERKLDYVLNYASEKSANKEIKIFALQNLLKNQFQEQFVERMVWTKKALAYDFGLGLSDTVVLLIRDILAYSAIIFAILRGNIEVSEFLFYFGVITNFSLAVNQLTTNIGTMSQRSWEIASIKEYSEKELATTGLSTASLAKDTLVEFKNVTFCYPDDQRKIIDNVSFQIKKGEKIALIGENGSGKTTLIKLMCGLYQPTSGEILINNDTVGNTEQLQQVFSVVFQDIFLLPFSVGENIALTERYDKEKVTECLSLAGLESLSANLDAPMTKAFSQEGIVLSGGQTQKIAIARSAYRFLYEQAQLLILDEPTAALDPLAERKFYEMYDRIAAEISSVFISHRLASTQFCDRILFLKDGKLAESGTHEELLELKGHYYELYEIQSKYYQ